MKIKSLEIENFRGFFGKHKLEFSIDQEKSITLIIGENGTGKSNILEAINWCLYGEMPESSQDDDGIINYSAKKRDKTAKTIVRLEVLGDRNEKYLVSRESSKNGYSGDLAILEHTKGRNPPWNAAKRDFAVLIDELLPKNLSKFFLYSGEGVNKLFSDQEEDTLRASIEDMQGFSYTQLAISNLQSYVDHLQTLIIKEEKATKAELEKKTKLQKKQAEIDTYVDERKDKQTQEKELQKEIRILKEQLGNSDINLVAEKTKHNNTLDNLISQLRAERDKSMFSQKNILNDSGFFVLTYSLEKDLSKFFKEQEDMKIFPTPWGDVAVERILNDPENNPDKLCICGRPVGHSEESHIMNQKDSTSTQKQTRNADKIKDLFTEYAHRNKHAREKYRELQEIAEECELGIKNHLGTKKKNEEIIKKNSDKKALKLQQKRKDLENELEDLQGKIAVISYQIDKLNDSKKEISKQYGRNSSSSKIDKSVEEKINFVQVIIDNLVSEIEIERKEGRENLLEKLQEITKRFNRKGEYFEYASKSSFRPLIIDPDTDSALPPNQGTVTQTAIYYALGLISVSLQRLNSKSPIAEPGTVAPMICDAVFSTLDPTNTASVAEMLCEIPSQTIMILSSGAFRGDVEEEIKKSNKLSQAYYLQRSGPSIDDKSNLSSMTVNNKQYKVFLKDKVASNHIKKLLSGDL